MRTLSAIDLLNIWEQGRDQTPIAQALILLAAALTESSEELARLSIGQRDVKLLLLRQHIFGSRLSALTECPACGEKIETELDIEDLMIEAMPSTPEALTIIQDDFEMSFRLPNSLDLLTVTTDMAPERARKHVLGRCLIEARRDGKIIEPPVLMDGMSAAIAQRMAEADPQGNRELTLHCPSCAGIWREVLDVFSFLWVEIQHRVRRLLCDVHELASAYGWREAEILQLSPWRRQAYLDLVRQ